MNRFLLEMASLLERYDAEIEANDEFETEITLTLDREHYDVIDAKRFTAEVCREKAKEFKSISTCDNKPSVNRYKFRAGDIVHHKPTGEKWVLAVDQFDDSVSPCGWPESVAKAEDCTLVELASEPERLRMLEDSSGITNYKDVRKKYAVQQLCETIKSMEKSDD